jgi:membrane protease YdiL (CAAX protease family)
VFFTALHFTLELFLPIFVLGLFLAWLYEYTGSLYPGILLHAANNALALIAFLVLQAAGLTPV